MSIELAVIGRKLGLVVVGALVMAGQALPQRTVPARSLPVPSTVSPEMQKLIATAPNAGGDVGVRTDDQWRALIKAVNDSAAKEVGPMKARLHVSVEEKTMAGVHVYDVKPAVIAPDNRRRVLVNLHGGGYVMFGGEALLPEALEMAYFSKTEVIAVDYRMPPDAPFPAAVDDAVAVWKEVIRSYTPRNVGLFGTSAGGGLTLATVLRLKELGLPLPGALMAGTPWSDLSKTGDSYFTNEYVDNVLGTMDGGLIAGAKLYAGKHDLKEPLLSPVYGDLSGFPPTVLITGTRDLFLSNTVRVHQKLLEAGGDAELLVFEGQSHAQYLLGADSPEGMSAFREICEFLDRRLGR